MKCYFHPTYIAKMRGLRVPRIFALYTLVFLIVKIMCPLCDVLAEEEQFKKNGEMIFFRQTDSKKIAQIDIEISDTPLKMVQGLMRRSFLPQNAGMLFIFHTSKLRTFWMKNTLIPLDIIFVSEHWQIVTIQKKTIPLSEEPIPSLKEAMYVVEVNSGFCGAHHIKEGDFITLKQTD
ncbi:MAG: DUF192 domain-containing protein [Dissulfurispiraceae bacterium]